jgi:hypothetical protein
MRIVCTSDKVIAFRYRERSINATLQFHFVTRPSCRERFVFEAKNFLETLIDVFRRDTGLGDVTNMTGDRQGEKRHSAGNG